MNYRPQNSSAPIPSSNLLPSFDLEAFRRNIMDSTEIYRSDYMRTMPRDQKTNMCWFSAICDLVNTASGGIVLDFECLLNHINYARYQQGYIAHSMQTIREQGLSLQDMMPIFEFFEKEVLVFNAADDLVFRYEGRRKRNKRIKPYNWAFLMAHNHVYPIHDYNSRNHPKYQVNRHGDSAFGNNRITIREEVIGDAPPMAFMFPPHLRQPSRHLKLTSPETPEINRLIHVLYRDTSLFQLLIQPSFAHKDRNVIVLVDRKDRLETIYLQMVHEYNHRPECFFVKDMITTLHCNMHGHYKSLVFKRMGHLNTEKNPDMIQTVDQFLLFERKTFELRRLLYRTEHLSFVSSSTFDIFDKFTRKPFIGAFPGSNSKLLKNAAAVDFNRLYGYALQSVEFVPVLYPYSKFVIPTAQVQSRFPMDCFVLGKVHGTFTAFLHQEYCVVYYPHLLEHIHRHPKRQISFTYNPVFNHGMQTTFEILFYCELTQKVPLGDVLSKHMKSFWEQPGIPKVAKKTLFNTSIGILGSKRNDLKNYHKGIVLDSPDEMNLLGENYTSENFHVVTLDDSNFAVVPSIQQCVNRFQTGMPFHQLIVDAAVLHVANFIDDLLDKGVEVLQIQTDEIYFPADQMPLVEEFIHIGDNNSFEANGSLKVSKEGGPAFDFVTPTEKTCHKNFLQTMQEIQRMQPCFQDYEMLPPSVDIQEYPRILLTASVPGAGKTHRIASQEGVTGVIAVPTNALAVDIKSKFPQHNVVTIHRLLSKVGRAFGLLDMIQDKDETPEEREDESTIPKKIFRETDSFLCIDEIYMLPTNVLLALYHLLHFLPPQITHVYATGDPYQLDPVEDRRTAVNSSKAREAMIIRIFKKRINLTRCRRMNNEYLNRRVEKFCSFLRNNRGLQNPKLRMNALRSVCHEHSVRMITQYSEIVDIMKAQEDMLIAAYTNETCHKITKHVLGSLEAKLNPGIKLINRKRIFVRGTGRMQLNYIYEVQDYNPDLRMVKLLEIKSQEMTDEDETEDDPGFWIDQDHVVKHMHWHRTRTAHCLQGTSWNGGVIVCDVDRKHLVNRAFFYVTMTRARDFDRLFVYMPEYR